MSRIVIADEQDISREGLRSLLSQIPGCEVLACVKNGKELFELLKNCNPDLLILNHSLPDLGGIASLEQLKRSPVLVLSNQNIQPMVMDAIKAGAKGYILKSTGLDEIEFAIKSILKGLVYITPQAANSLLNPNAENELHGLSLREKEVLKLLAEGIPNRDVAKKLHISNRTIDSHRSNIMKKLGAKSNSELVQIAMRVGLIG